MNNTFILVAVLTVLLLATNAFANIISASEDGGIVTIFQGKTIVWDFPCECQGMEAEISIKNASGKEIASGSTHESIIHFDTSDWMLGDYFVTVTIGEYTAEAFFRIK